MYKHVKHGEKIAYMFNIIWVTNQSWKGPEVGTGFPSHVLMSQTRRNLMITMEPFFDAEQAFGGIPLL